MADVAPNPSTAPVTPSLPTSYAGSPGYAAAASPSYGAGYPNYPSAASGAPPYTSNPSPAPPPVGGYGTGPGYPTGAGYPAPNPYAPGYPTQQRRANRLLEESQFGRGWTIAVLAGALLLALARFLHFFTRLGDLDSRDQVPGFLALTGYLVACGALVGMSVYDARLGVGARVALLVSGFALLVFGLSFGFGIARLAGL